MRVSPIPGTAKVTLHHVLWGQPLVTTMYYTTQDGSPPDALALLGDYVKAQLTATVRPAMHTGHSIVGLTLQRADNWDTAGMEYTAGFPLVGTQTVTATHPAQVCAVIAHKTQLRGRSYQGRTYWPGMTTNMTSGNNLTTAQQALYKTLFDALIAPNTASGGNPVWEASIASFYHNKQLRVPTGVATPIQSNVVRSLLGTQRRRLK